MVQNSFFSLPTCGNGIRCCSVVSCVGGLGTDSYLEKPKRRMFLAFSVVGLIGMVIFSGIALLPLLVRIREHAEFFPPMNLDRSAWPRCLAWHGWLPALSPRRVQTPWAVAEVDSVDAALETALGAYPVHPGENLRPGWDPDDIIDLADSDLDHPNIWTDGNRDEDLNAKVGVAGAVAYVKNVLWVF